MKNLAYFLLICNLFSCSLTKNSEKDIISIDPRIFPEVEISLSDIADGVSYIPLDNQIPIGNIYSYKIINGFVYAAIKDVGVVRFTNTGKLDRHYGKIGRGPGEYIYCLSFAVDENTGMVYVMDHKIDDVEVYTNDGLHVRKIELPVDDEGFGLSDIEFFNSSLVIAQYINMGRGVYDWIVLDTLGNRVSEKRNPYPVFKGRQGSVGRLFKYGGDLGYWDSFKDTVFNISTDFDYKTLCLFTAGEHRLPMTTEKYNPPRDFLHKIGVEYIMPILFFETKYFFVYNYDFKKARHWALIYKNNNDIKLVSVVSEKKGIFNNIDVGLDFIPMNYFEIDNKEYLTSIIQPFELKAHVASEAFKNSTPKYPEKKKELEKLANSLDENDNPVLMLVKLKD